jgi:hypothetical protein
MGGEIFESTGIGESAEKVFKKLVEEAQWEHGHGGYTGTIAEKDGFIMLQKPAGISVEEFVEEKIDENEKWGPAFSIELTGEDAEKYLKGRKGRVFKFFGWASS